MAPRRALFMMLLSLLQRTGAFSNCRQGYRRHVHRHINYGGRTQSPPIRSFSSLPVSSSDDQPDTNQLGELQAILQRNNITTNELNESCLRALSSCPPPMANDALKAYTVQKRRREMNGTEKISNPSSYVLAVLRNNMKESAPSAPTANRGVAKRNDLQNVASSPASKPVVTPPSKNVPDETTTRMQQIETQQQRADASKAQERKDDANAERVERAYVDKCLASLAKLEQPVTQLSGIGPKTQSAFNKLGIYTLRDLLFHFPRSFIDRSELQQSIYNVPDGEVGTFKLAVPDRAKQNSVTCTDEAGNEVEVIFFYGRSRQGAMMASNAMKKLCKESTMIVSGRIKHGSQKAEIFNPDVVVTPDQAGTLGIEPVYALASGLTQKKMVSAIDGALTASKDLFALLPESLSRDVREKLKRPTLAEAVVLAHRPTAMEDTGLGSPARERIAFEELCMQQAQLGLSKWKLKYQGVGSSSEVQGGEVHSSWRESPLVSAAASSLPFDLTPSQEACLEEMWSDALGGDGRMTRLLQGDVGSGKTVLAYLLGLGCIEACQGGAMSLLCPTQLLAAQHHKTISSFADRLQERCGWNIRVELLTGSVVGKAREELLARLEGTKENNAVILIGTHALATSDVAVRLKNLPAATSKDSKGLALAVVDEEQRFGVRQREAFQSAAAHCMSMTATPIPRTISQMKSGMMDTTLLEQVNSQPIETTIVSSDNLGRVVNVLKNKLEAGSKCFWVLPRIEQSTASSDDGGGDSTTQQGSVLERYNSLVDEIGEEQVRLVHGRMTQAEREDELNRFTELDAGVLVGTTVIEVGIDVPNVNILIVEEADRFGLSQLHQLRGRIGRAGSRAELKCHCLLLSKDIGANPEDSQSVTRLQILQKSSRGDQIADADFMLRGPGDALGFAQSGIKSGLTVDPGSHWSMLGAATRYGRKFLQETDTPTELAEPSSPANDTLVGLLKSNEGETRFYSQTSASSTQGLALRVMMSLFGEWRSDEGSTLDALETLQQLDESTGGLSEDDRSIHAELVDLARSFCDGCVDLQDVNPGADEAGEASMPLKPQLAGFGTQVPTGKRVDLTNALFVVLDVETTGLDDKTCHVIQLAAKVLGSDDADDLFSEYILPPIDRVPKNIEELTGITDDFLRRGGFDRALGIEREPAKGFREVFASFQDFCDERADGRHVVLVAHNAKFDVRMLNGELRRWRHEQAAAVPTLGDVFSSSVDTLQLFREKKWWGPSSPLSKPSSFSLSELHSHVFNESFSDSHNAVGDIKALERLLLADPFDGWQSRASKIQQPFIKLDKKT
ncbi:hypothetical protein ACHAXT_008368 [Thalassiosira profunda]